MFYFYPYTIFISLWIDHSMKFLLDFSFRKQHRFFVFPDVISQLASLFLYFKLFLMDKKTYYIDWYTLLFSKFLCIRPNILSFFFSKWIYIYGYHGYFHNRIKLDVYSPHQIMKLYFFKWILLRQSLGYSDNVPNRVQKLNWQVQRQIQHTNPYRTT